MLEQIYRFLMAKAPSADKRANAPVVNRRPKVVSRHTLGAVLLACCAGTFIAPATSIAATGTVIRINAGGGQYTDSAGNVWSADTGYNTGSSTTVTTPISGTVDDALFQSERWDGSSSPELAYSLDVPDGNYTVNLYFAEIYGGITASGQRVFDVALQGTTVLQNFDIFSEAGSNTALIKSFPVTVSGGKLNIQFTHVLENPKISAIEVIAAPQPSAAAIRINAGGPKYVDAAGNVWQADTGYNTGSATTVTTPISGTNDDALFQSERWDGSSSPELAYSLAVPDGNYTVNLYFAEIYGGITASGQRVFDVALQGKTVLQNFDIFSEAGSNTALIKSFPVTVSGGKLNIQFTHVLENPKISAIEVVAVPQPSAAIRVNAGGPKYVDAAGNVWQADTGYNTGSSTTVTTPISGTVNDALFQSERWDGSSSPELAYSLAVPDGNYTVNLYFAEIYGGITASGQRVFDVALQGKTVLQNFDIFSEAGSNTALIKSFSVTVIGGKLNIQFTHVLENPKISAIEVIPAPQPTTAIRVNAGGPKYVDAAGNVWQSDTGYNTGSSTTVTTPISGTVNDALFQSERWDDGAAPELAYSFKVPSGSYLVNLSFAEIYSGITGPNQRLFDVAVEGQNAISNLDIYSEAGPNAALVKSIAATVNDGALDIQFTHVVQNPKVSAIEIVPISSTSLTNSDGAPVTIDVLGRQGVLLPAGVSIAVAPDHGTAVVQSDNTILYTPVAGYTGSDSLTYMITDAGGNVIAGTVNVQVTCTSCSPSNTVVLSWQPNPDVVSGYKIYFGTSAATVTSEISDIAVGSVNFDPSAPSVSYSAGGDLGLHTGDQACFQVKAYNSTGMSNPSEVACLTL